MFEFKNQIFRDFKSEFREGVQGLRAHQTRKYICVEDCIYFPVSRSTVLELLHDEIILTPPAQASIAQPVVSTCAYV
jgi:hypothetical protein